MSFLAGSAIATLGLDANPFRAGLMESHALMSVFPSWVTNLMANPLLGLANIAKSAFGFLKDALMESTGHADAMGDMAANVGVAVEALSGLGLVAEQAGSSTEAVAQAYKFLGSNIADAMQKADSESAKTFSSMGINLTDAAGKARPLEDVMMAIADSLAMTEDPARRTQIAMDLLGRSGSDLIATLRQGSGPIQDQIRGFEKYGAVVTSANASASDAFQDLLGEARIAWRGISNTIAEPLRDALTPHLRDLLSWVQTNMPEIQRGVMTAINSIVAALGFLADRAKETWGILDGTYGRAAEWVAQATMGDRADANKVTALRTREDALREKAATYNIFASPGDSSGQLKAKIDEAVRRADIASGRISRLDAEIQRVAVLAGL